MINRQDKSLPPQEIHANLQKWKKLDVEYVEFSEYFANSISKSDFNQSFLNQLELTKYEEITVFQNS